MNIRCACVIFRTSGLTSFYPSREFKQKQLKEIEKAERFIKNLKNKEKS